MTAKKELLDKVKGKNKGKRSMIKRRLTIVLRGRRRSK